LCRPAVDVVRNRGVDREELPKQLGRDHRLLRRERHVPVVARLSRVDDEEGSRQLHGAGEPGTPGTADVLRAGDVAEGEVGIRLVHAALDRATGRGAGQVGRADRRRVHEGRGGDDRENERESAVHAPGGYRGACALQSRSRRGGPQVTARDANTGRAPGTGVMPRPTPVPAPPPGVTDVLRRSARLGLGALGLVSRAAGSVFARVPDGSAAEHAEPAGPLALLPGAVLGLAIEAERRAATGGDAVAERTASGG